MCSNYQPVTQVDRLRQFFGVEGSGGTGSDGEPAEVFPLGLAPFIRLADPRSGDKARALMEGNFGLIPAFTRELKFGKKTYNARSETVAEKPSFRSAWKRGQRCVVPAERIYEPNWETGAAVRWSISFDRYPMAIAGIYEKWRDTEDKEHFSFAMLTVNADDHELMKRFHRPGEEKSMVVILDPADIDDWLTCSVAQAPKFFRQWPAQDLVAVPAPLPRRVAAKKVKPAEPPLPKTGDLF